VRAASRDAAVGDPRLSAFRFPSSFVKEDKSKGGRRRMEMSFSNSHLAGHQAWTLTRRESASPFRPREAGEGDHWSSRSERTVVEGAPDAEIRFRCGRFSSQEETS
jgi:hypothetical protein